jgi:hypothetical protein
VRVTCALQGIYQFLNSIGFVPGIEFKAAIAAVDAMRYFALTHSHTHTHSFTHSLIHSFTHSLTNSFTHSLPFFLTRDGIFSLVFLFFLRQKNGSKSPEIVFGDLPITQTMDKITKSRMSSHSLRVVSFSSLTDCVHSVSPMDMMRLMMSPPKMSPDLERTHSSPSFTLPLPPPLSLLSPSHPFFVPIVWHRGVARSLHVV